MTGLTSSFGISGTLPAFSIKYSFLETYGT